MISECSTHLRLPPDRFVSADNKIVCQQAEIENVTADAVSLLSLMTKCICEGKNHLK